MGQPESVDPEEFVWSPEGITPRRGNAAPAIPAAAPAPPVDESEVRRYPRIDLKVPVLYRIQTEAPTGASHALSPEKTAETSNLSGTGVCLVLAEQLAEGTVISMTIHIPDEQQKISAVARVVWNMETNVMHHFLTGLCFIHLYKKTSHGTEYVTASILQKFLHKA